MSKAASLRYFLTMVFLLPTPSFGSPFDGEWKSESYGCEGLSGRAASECATEPPSFDLEFWSKGNHLCGVFSVTTGDKADSDDEKPMIGSLHGNVATLSFQSSFGATGIARIKLSKGKLNWTILKEQDTERLGYVGGTLLPSTDVLARNGTPLGRHWLCEKWIRDFEEFLPAH